MVMRYEYAIRIEAEKFERERIPRQIALDTALRDIVTDDALLAKINSQGGESPHLPLIWQRGFWGLNRERLSSLPSLSLTGDGALQFHIKDNKNVAIVQARLLSIQGEYAIGSEGTIPIPRKDIALYSHLIDQSTNRAFVITEGGMFSRSGLLVGGGPFSASGFIPGTMLGAHYDKFSRRNMTPETLKAAVMKNSTKIQKTIRRSQQ